MDIRALLAGDKIALIKTETQWTAQFGSLAAAFEDGKKAKNCENGVSYQGYLKGFLYTVSSERLAYRMMDIMERQYACIQCMQTAAWIMCCVA